MSQKSYWEKLHSAGGMDQYRGIASDYVRSVAGRLAARSVILELGCGAGGDARYLSDVGHTVIATDVSESVIEANRATMPDLSFLTLDTEETFPFDNEMFDVVYANLSLHYSDDAHTRATMGEIWRVLRPEGRLMFRCKSIHSVGEKEGAEEIEPNIYVKNGHLRHLFSTDYVTSLLAGKFTMLRNEYTAGDAYGFESYFVECEAEKRGGFLAGRYISELHLRPDDPWVDYYRQDPDRFLETKSDLRKEL